jgi:uncharacterized protein (DUF1697 family)
MRTHVALLRGVNVGGRNKLAMAELRRSVESLGHTQVATYLQSGNVVFASTGDDPVALAAELQDLIARELGLRCVVVVLSRAEWAEVVAGNPYPEESDPRHLHAVVQPSAPSTEDLAALQAAQQRAGAKGSADELTVVGRTVYLRTPDGMGRSELAAQLARSPRTAAGTARNWTTVVSLMALLDG